MEKLLHWSIANSQGDKEAIERVGQPDSKLLKELFQGGPDEPALMKQAITVILNPEATLDAKLTACDNFEMLIENLDHANNIENLKLWEPIIDIMDSNESELRSFALSIIGTAVQNNKTSQDNFLSYPKGLARIVDIAKQDNENEQPRCKAFYALSNLVRHNPSGLAKFENLHGLDLVAPVLQNSGTSEKLQVRVLAFLTAILSAAHINQEFVDILRQERIIHNVLALLRSDSYIYVVDRVLQFSAILIAAGAKFNEEELSILKRGLMAIEPLREQINEDDFLTVKHVL
ncbi:LAMI_0E09670g1_1 [Lachancea mirantina]|uniref:Hsp70 nucleotide exchange factor FES1 n=1 Tax=Lachancea mirantina TaxID=1230905 RepID=A0A1G4JNT7_9SACH|nr:LAMI_0E09670g1_1 [Lachancea mirantina]